MAVGFDVNPITPVGAQVKPVEGMSLGDMVNIARGMQAYRSGAITLSKQEQENAERLAAQQFFSNPENFQTGGRIDMAKVNAAIPQIAPLTGRDIMKNLADVSSAQTQADTATRNLTTDSRRVVSMRLGILGRAGVKDPQAYAAELDQLGREYKDDENMSKAVDAYKGLLSRIPAGDAVPQLAIRASQSMMTPTEQQAAFTPSISFPNLGAVIQPTAITPQPGGVMSRVEAVGAPMPLSLPPGSRIVPTGERDVNNNPTAYVYSADGNFVGEIPIPAGAPSGSVMGGGGRPVAPPSAAPRGPVMPPVGPSAMRGGETVRRLPAGETPDTYAAANKIRLDAQTAATSVPNQLFNNNQIIGIVSSGDVATGKGAQTLANLGGGFAAIPWSTDAASNLNKLGHYMSLQTGNLAASAGFNTDSSRSIAEQQTGTTEWTADAIKNTARVNRSLATATDYFNRGAQNAFAKTKDPFAVRDFRDKWAQTLDMDAVRLMDASRNIQQDPNGLAEVAIELGGVDSPRYKAALKKVGTLRSLIRGE